MSDMLIDDPSPGFGGPSPMVPSPAEQVQPPRVRKRRIHRTGQVVDEAGEAVRQAFLKFLKEYKPDHFESTDFDSTNTQSEAYYLSKLRNVYDVDEVVTLYIDFNHLRQNDDLQRYVQVEFMRVLPFLRQALKDFARENEEQLVDDGEPKKTFAVGFYNLPMHHKIRELKTDKIGQLTSVSGTVTRTSQVKPELIRGTFLCLECGAMVKNVEQQFKYTLPTKCSGNNCNNTKRFQLNVKQSQCCDWQKVRLQENSEDIPAGSMPRSIDVILRDDVVEKCKPGDKVLFTGSLVPIPDVAQLSGKSVKFFQKRHGSSASGSAGLTGLKALGVRSLTCKLVFLASSVVSIHNALGTANIREEEEDPTFQMTDEEKQEIIQMKNSANVYADMAKSIAPNVFGHDDIKRGILLMLFGGVHKVAQDKTKLRGDINICIVGDPSTAKSQFLKYVTKLLPRTVYTSGKASTSAGLTASVCRDPETGEFGIEAGALMLADNGVCCIDEFDKMDPKDQAAIHEAMEQQTITITKAGIQATLNARASILAAANPRMGRYDTSRSLRANVDMSAPIMSRFDLFFVVVDECDEAIDTYIAKHIVNLHSGNMDAIRGPFPIAQIQNYIRLARSIKPTIAPDSMGLLVQYYRTFRTQDDNERKAYRFTVRQLESLIRLSEALARVHLSDTVTKGYVREAARLLKQSIITVDQGDVDFEDDQDEEREAMEEEVEGQDEAEKKFTIKYDEYVKTAKAVVYRIRAEDVGEGVQQKTAEAKVLEDMYAEGLLSDTEALLQAQSKLLFVIRRLIDVDNILLVRQDAEEEKERILEVHPNYDPDAAYEIQDRKKKERKREMKKGKRKKKKKTEDVEMEDAEGVPNAPDDDEDDEEELMDKDEVLPARISEEVAALVEETLPETIPQSLPETIPQEEGIDDEDL